MIRAGCPGRPTRTRRAAHQPALDQAGVARRVLGLDRQLDPARVVGGGLQQPAHGEHLGQLGVVSGASSSSSAHGCFQAAKSRSSRSASSIVETMPPVRRTPQVAVVHAHEVAVGGRAGRRTRGPRRPRRAPDVGAEGVLGVVALAPRWATACGRLWTMPFILHFDRRNQVEARRLSVRCTNVI